MMQLPPLHTNFGRSDTIFFSHKSEGYELRLMIITKGFLIIRNKLFSITAFKRKQLYNSVHIFAPKNSDLSASFYHTLSTFSGLRIIAAVR